MRRGTGLMAGPPTSSPRPGRVTVPTPGPPASAIPGVSLRLTVAWISAPCVISGSSPASLITPQRTQPGPNSQRQSAKVASRPTGRWIVTRSTGRPLSRASAAALAAAVAQAPVV